MKYFSISLLCKFLFSFRLSKLYKASQELQLMQPVSSERNSLLLDNGFVDLINCNSFHSLCYFLFSRLLKKPLKSVPLLFTQLKKPFIRHKKHYKSNLVCQMCFPLDCLFFSSRVAGLATEAKAKGRFREQITRRKS